MRVAADKTIRVPNVDHVAVPAHASRANDDAVADRPDRGARRRGVIGAGVLPAHAQDGMPPHAEH